MKSINLILTYVGRLPNYFHLFLQSCAWNPTVSWTLLVDREPPHPLPRNVRWIPFSMEDLRVRSRRVFDIEINFTDPYKLCEIRPMLAVLYPEIVSGFDIWGHCDPDVLWGDVRRLLPTNGSSSPPKIQMRGACSMYSNDEAGNNLFRLPHERIRFEDVLRNPRYALFDEWHGLWKLLKENSVDYWLNDREVAEFDVDCYELRLDYSRQNHKFQLFAWERGRVYRYYLSGPEICRDEFAYMHLQKRRFTVTDGLGDRFLVLPDRFLAFPSAADLHAAFRMNRRHVFRSFLKMLSRPKRYWRSRSIIDRAFLSIPCRS